MSKVITVEDLSREEQIDVIIGKFSGHERMDEIASIFSTLTSYKINGDDYVKYYDGLATEEIEEIINNSILNNVKDNVFQKEECAWNSIINALGIKTIFDVMDNWDKYVGRSIKIQESLDDIKKDLYLNYLLEY